MPEYKCIYICSSCLFRPSDTLQDFFLILVQTNSKGRVSGTTDLHFVHLYLCKIQLLKRRKKKRVLDFMHHRAKLLGPVCNGR